MLGSCVLTDLDRLEINTETILGVINRNRDILADFLGKSGRLLTADIELMAADKTGRQSMYLL
ncbi:hypothetical protein [Bacteroides sp. Marseille-P8574]|uniref:hypothetical protein n=1 Tax=Bacteroides sp. Marseille-P8574 TaxID=2697504 RepID=UPI00157BFE82|nr:hypothetical protein [Bacteroides sp. Marseille-P8574]